MFAIHRSRRWFGAVASAAFLAACGPKAIDPGPSTPETPIVIGTTAALTDLDPALAGDVLTLEIIKNTTAPLLDFKLGESVLTPVLAEGEPVISSDGKTYTVKIKTGSKFADGTAVDAQSFVAAFSRLKTLAGTPWQIVAGSLANVEAVEANTVRYTLTQPVAFFRALLAVPALLPVNSGMYPATKGVSSPFTTASASPTWGDTHVDETKLDVTQLLGNGPYRVNAITSDATLGITEIKLTANPEYLGTAPKTKDITIKKLPDSAGLLAALQSGDVDVAWRELDPAMYATIGADSAFKLHEVSFVRMMNLRTNAAPFNVQGVRQAIAAAVDRSAIVRNAMGGHARALFSPVPAGMWSHTDVFKDEYGERNLDRAKTLLTNAGYSTSSKLAFDLWFCSTRYGEAEITMAQALKTAIEETGMVTVTLKDNANWTTFRSETRAGQYAAALRAWFPDFIDPDNYLSPFVSANAGTGQGIFYVNSQMDTLLSSALAEVDYSQRTARYQQIQQLWATDVPSIPLIQRFSYLAAKSSISLSPPRQDSLLLYDQLVRQ